MKLNNNSKPQNNIIFIVIDFKWTENMVRFMLESVHTLVTTGRSSPLLVNAPTMGMGTYRFFC